MPRLVEFDKKFADKHDRFQILTFHHTCCKTLAEMDKKLERKYIKDAWKGKPLSIPVLMDSTGVTMKTWEIHAFPTTVIINPEGKLMKNGNTRMVEEALKKPVPAQSKGEKKTDLTKDETAK